MNMLPELQKCYLIFGNENNIYIFSESLANCNQLNKLTLKITKIKTIYIFRLEWLIASENKNSIFGKRVTWNYIEASNVLSLIKQRQFSI